MAMVLDAHRCQHDSVVRDQSITILMVRRENR
eukprot:SAG31_NODE_43661_length_266_cov_0.622754_1_plen_31_part_10